MSQSSILGTYAAEARMEQERLVRQREAPLTVGKIALGVFLGMELFAAVDLLLWGLYSLVR